MKLRLPSSAVKVLHTIVETGPQCPHEISETSDIALRTVSHAIKRLMRHKLLRRIPNLEDMRKPIYAPDIERARELLSKYGQDSIIGTQLTMILRR